MALFVYGNGTAVEVLNPTSVKVNANRTWQDVQAIRLMVGGVWQDVWPKPFADINGFNVDGGGRLAGYRINANGNAESVTNQPSMPVPTYRYGVLEKWLKKGSANQFVVKAVKDPNSLYLVPVGSPLDTWLDCSTSPQWTIEGSGKQSRITVHIGRVDGSGGGAAITDNASSALQDSAGNAMTDTTLTVTEMDSAVIGMTTVLF